ncbi:MAG: 2-dehydropantoate 2-reductase [Kiritimatiellia bacterium]|jgi:hypothetical protein
MRIYLDFDDVLCETARQLARLAGELFGRDVPYSEIRAFDLRTSFDLDIPQYERLMAHAHGEGILGISRAADGMSRVVHHWLREGLGVDVVTGRPWASHALSRAWLDRRGLADVPLYHVDKYGREPRSSAGPEGRSWTLAEFDRVRYDVAVDDAPAMLDVLASRPDCHTIVFDRPWNRAWTPPAGTASRVRRCHGWSELDLAIRSFRAAKRASA